MEKVIATATQAARAAARVIAGAHTDLGVAEKGRNELVTEVDLESQRVVIATIRDAFPGHAVLGEEAEQTAALDSPALWIVDPLDGTNNFVHGVPQFSVSIAYAEHGEILAGVVLDPNRDELFEAVKGRGATRNGEPIQVTGRDRLDQVMVATGFYYERDVLMEQTLDAIRALFRRHIRGIRRFGSAALDLSWVACGRFDAFFEYRLSPWDFAAGCLLIQEAGGRCEDRFGAPAGLGSGSMVAANPVVFDAFAEVVRCRQ